MLNIITNFKLVFLLHFVECFLGGTGICPVSGKGLVKIYCEFGIEVADGIYFRCCHVMSIPSHFRVLVRGYNPSSSISKENSSKKRLFVEITTKVWSGKT